MTRQEKLAQLVQQWEAAGRRLLDEARDEPPYEFAWEACPLRDDKDCRHNSNELFGCGCFMWTCGFCGSWYES